MPRLTRILIVLCLLAPMGASPLGVGDITLHSALNQPLDADIELTAMGQTRIEDIKVGLASQETFENAGLDRSLLLTSLNFEVKSSDSAVPYVKVTSADPVKEPFLDFIVDIDWPSGHLVREYTLLLDPPVLIDEEPMPVAAPMSGEAVVTGGEVASGVMLESAQPPVPAGEVRPEATVSSTGVMTYGPVKRSDTLWSIANQLKSDDKLSTEQIMLGLLKSNPDAFYNNNINELKAGYVLRISDPAVLTEMSRAAAAAEVLRQNEQWLDSKRTLAGMAGATPQGAGAEGDMAGAAASGSGVEGPRLRLSVPEAADAGQAAPGAAETTESGTPANTDIGKLRSELSAAQEASAASRQENAELHARVTELEKQLEAAQRLATLKNDTLASLQAGAAAPASEDHADTTVAGGSGGTTPPVAEPAPARKAEPPLRAAPPASAELLRNLTSDPKMLAIAGAALVLLLTLAWLIVRRRRAAVSFESLADDVSGGSGERQDADYVAPAWMTAAAQQQAEVAGEESSVHEGAHAAEDSSVDIMQAEEDEIDILAEADVYLAYRRFDKAEELLKEAMKAEPERRDLMLKLLEVYAASGNKNAFVPQAEQLKTKLGSGDGALWEKVSAMGKRLAPEHALFGGTAAVAGNPATPRAAVPEPEHTDSDVRLGLGEDFSDLTLDADIDAELNRLADGSADAGPEVTDVAVGATLTDTEAALPSETSIFEGELSLDEPAVPESADDDLSKLFDEQPSASEPTFGSPRVSSGSANVIDFESRVAGLGQPSHEQDRAGADGGQAAEQRPDSDIDWLMDVGKDLADLGDADETAGDDFSALITGEDEVGTKLDLAKAYIDMGDQESARNILSEVAEEGNQDQQREASDLMRQIG